MANIGSIIVTGADGGLGVSVVNQLLTDGWQVSAVVHHNDKIKPLQERFTGAALSVQAADLTREEAVNGMISAIPSFQGIVHLAGGFIGGATLNDHPTTVFDRMFDLNTRSTFLLLSAVMPRLKKNKGGSIITVGAKPALHPSGENAVYAASKAALINLTLSAAEEGRSDQVRANVIVPAVIRTQSNLQWASSEKEAAKWTPPEDIASVISWLASEKSASVTGTVIPLYHGLKAF